VGGRHKIRAASRKSRGAGLSLPARILFAERPLATMPIYSTPVAVRSNLGCTLDAQCPFHDGLATLDLFLAELDPRETALFDAALDLRALASARTDGDACVAQLFHVRMLLDGRHHLAFYRVRCWANRALRIACRSHRGADWITSEFAPGAGSVNEVVNTALAGICSGEVIPASAHARFVFA
jgi:hypothetical protein